MLNNFFSLLLVLDVFFLLASPTRSYNKNKLLNRWSCTPSSGTKGIKFNVPGAVQSGCINMS